MKITLRENERGFLFKDGKYIRLLGPGKHRFLGSGYEVEPVEVNAYPISLTSFDLDTLIKDPVLAKELTVVDVVDGTIVLHYINGTFQQALTSGQYVFWNINQNHRFDLVDMADPFASETIPAYLFPKIPSSIYQRIEVLSFQKGLLTIGGKFICLLEPGTHFFWTNGKRISVIFVDTRLLQMNIQGQEMLTKDKVAVRINFVIHYKITDYIKIITEIQNYEEQIHVLTQLALRKYIGGSRLDELLENREEMADFVLNQLKEKEEQCFVQFLDAGVKDMVLPGEIREIMNTVLIAEKRAQANVITRREEVASTRSLLNTAKLMEENPTLLHLKEMECLEKICENVGNITVNGSGDVISQLVGMMKGGAK